jgi:hypothetical protein
MHHYTNQGEYSSSPGCNSGAGYVADRVGGLDLQLERSLVGNSNALRVNSPNGIITVGGRRRRRRRTRRRGGSVAGVISSAIVPAALLAMQNQMGRRNIYKKSRRSRRMR